MKNATLSLVVLLFFALNTFGQEEALIWKRYKGEITDPNIPLLQDYSFAGYKLGEEAIPEDSGLLIFNVTDYGAIANDENSDQAAIQAAIYAAEANNGGVVFFPPGEFLVNTDPNDLESILITQSNIIIKGSGSELAGGTIINMKNHMLLPADSINANTPKMFIFKPSNPSQTSTNITQNAAQGDFMITVTDASIFANEKFINLEMTGSEAQETYDYYLDNKTPSSEFENILNFGVKLKEIHEISSINLANNTITLTSPLLDRINANNTWKARTITLLENCGVEDIQFKANFYEEFKHHLNYIHDYGWHAFKMENVANSWVRRMRFSNITGAVRLENVFASTISTILIDGTNGHSTNSINSSTSILQALIWDNTDTGQHHGTDMSSRTAGSVVWRADHRTGRGWDLHGSQPRNNLIDNYKASDVIGQGGSERNLPNHLKGLTIWNQQMFGTAISDFNWWNIDCGENYCGHIIVNPTIVGMHGVSTTFDQAHVNYEESNGTAVSPASLYQAQLEYRLGNEPAWISDAITEYERLKIDWYAAPEPEPDTVEFNLSNMSTQGSQTVTSGESLEIEAIVSDGIISVSLYLNDVLLEEINTSPFQWGHIIDANPELQNLQPGSYTLKLVATNSDGVEVEDEIVITVEDEPTMPTDLTISLFLPNLSVQGSQTINSGESLEIEAIVSDGIIGVSLYLNDVLLEQDNTAPFQWGHLIDSHPELQNLLAGSYTLKLVAITSDGVEVEDEIVITVDDELIEPKENELKIYPNPVTENVFTIDLSEEETNEDYIEISLYNLTGRFVDSMTSENVNGQIEFELGNNVSNSMYLVKVNGKSYYKVRPILISR